VDHVVHISLDLHPETDEEPSVWPDAEVDNGFELPFGDLDEGDEEFEPYVLSFYCLCLSDPFMIVL
jgi:hypothetical protein